MSQDPRGRRAELHNDALPFYAERQIPVSASLTDNRCEFCGTAAHPYELYLAFGGIEHWRTKGCAVPRPLALSSASSALPSRSSLNCRYARSTYASVDALQSAFARWLVHYHTE